MNFPLQLQVFSTHNCTINFFIPDAAAVKEAYQNRVIPFPYWSQVWPAAKALAQFLVHHPVYTTGKKVVELGAGLGLPSLVAARNARRVICTDYVPEAVAIAVQSAAHAGLQNFTAQVVDWQHLPSNIEADVLLLSDINYEPATFELLQKNVQVFMDGGTLVLLSTPQRLVAKQFIAPLLPFCQRKEVIAVEHEGTEVMITVLVLGK